MTVDKASQAERAEEGFDGKVEGDKEDQHAGRQEDRQSAAAKVLDDHKGADRRDQGEQQEEDVGQGCITSAHGHRLTGET